MIPEIKDAIEKFKKFREPTCIRMNGSTFDILKKEANIKIKSAEEIEYKTIYGLPIEVVDYAPDGTIYIL